MKKYLLGLVSVLLLISCSHVPETHYFTIDYPLVPAENTNGHGVLWVKKFDTDDLYSQDKFVYQISDYEVKFDNYRRWVSTPAELLTLQAVAHLRACGAFKRVTMVQPRDRNYLVLSGRIIKFQENLKGTDHSAQVALWIQVTSEPGHKILWSGLLQQKVRIEGASENAILKAMSEAVQNGFSELVDKLQANIS